MPDPLPASTTPKGGILGLTLAAVAFALNVQGFVALQRALHEFRINIGPILIFLTVVYSIILILDCIIIAHGFYKWTSARNRAKCCTFNHQCCYRTSILASGLLWMAFVLLLGQVGVSMLLCIAFLELNGICDKAVAFVERTNCTTGFSEFYYSSGLATAIELISEIPLELDDLEHEAEEEAQELADDPFTEALNKFCFQFGDDVVRATLFICAGAFVAVLAQMILLVYQSKYNMVWWYEEEEEGARRALNKRGEGGAREEGDEEKKVDLHPAAGELGDDVTTQPSSGAGAQQQQHHGGERQSVGSLASVDLKVIARQVDEG
mmetsp:Transcript_20120/g.37820  ORF Transcript_20120/g.37820 Transcript_20120/m.37820 type:complete len:322 (-) Transcript_20120:278-1243(-)